MKVTPTRPAGKLTQCLCLRVPCAELRLPGALGPLLSLLPGRLYHPPLAPAPEPPLPGATVRPDVSVCASWSVFSSERALLGPPWHRKRGSGLSRSHLPESGPERTTGFIGARSCGPHVLLQPPGGKWTDARHCPGVTGPLRRVEGNGFHRAPAMHLRSAAQGGKHCTSPSLADVAQGGKEQGGGGGGGSGHPALARPNA